MVTISAFKFFSQLFQFDLLISEVLRLLLTYFHWSLFTFKLKFLLLNYFFKTFVYILIQAPANKLTLSIMFDFLSHFALLN